MNCEVRAAAYLLVMLLEESANKFGRRDTTLSRLAGVPGIRKLKIYDALRVLRNCIVHAPCNYTECYRLLCNSTGRLREGFKVCATYTGLAEESDVDAAVNILLKFYKENK